MTKFGVIGDLASEFEACSKLKQMLASFENKPE